MMGVYEDREAFIPYSRQEIIELCLQDGKLSPLQAKKFKDFCEILAAYYHFKFHYLLENLKSNYAYFNPDYNGNISNLNSKFSQPKSLTKELTFHFEELLKKANYLPLSSETLEKAFQKKTLIELNTEVNLDDFEEIICYCRGDIYKEVLVKKWFKKVPETINLFEKVALLIKYKDYPYFKEENIDELKFNPGKVYVYLYKNIPKFDINFIFPNVKIKMTWKDRIILIVTAIGAAIPMFLKVLPRLLLIIGIILFLILGKSPIEQIKVSEKDVNNLLPILLASLSLLVTFGGFAVKQYLSYKNKQIKFQKNVTETLFFRKLAVNLGVFQSLIDAAEEEECKEIILVYYHLLTSEKLFKPEDLDDEIENWMENNFERKIDFDIHNTLESLSKIRGKINTGNSQQNGEYSLVEKSLLTYDKQGYCQILSLDEAKEIIDYVWDNIFSYQKTDG